MKVSKGNIIICRAAEVTDILSRQYAAVLSIEHTGAGATTGAAPRVDGVPQKILAFWDAETRVKDGPDAAQIREGITFALAHLEKGDVIIHCHAGKARSTGLALGVLAMLHPDAPPEELIDRLLAIRPQAAPNILVTEIADDIAGRKGALVRAVRDHGGLTAARAETERRRMMWLSRNPDVARKMFPEKFPQQPKDNGPAPKP